MNSDDTDDDPSPPSLAAVPVTSAHLLEIIEQAVDDDDLDFARGGVHATIISAGLRTRKGFEREPSTIREYLRQPEADGEIVRVRGLNSETYPPGISWLPPDHPHLSPPHLPESEL